MNIQTFLSQHIYNLLASMIPTFFRGISLPLPTCLIRIQSHPAKMNV